MQEKKIKQIEFNDFAGIFFVGFLLLLCSACETSTYMSVDAGAAVDESPPLPPPDNARLLVLRSARWPGGGRELSVGVLDQATGLPFSPDLSEKLRVTPTDGSTLKSKIRPMVLPPGYTAILLPPRLTKSERVSLSQAIVDFANKRPSTERIALYRHGTQVQLFSNFHLNRQRLSEALDRYQNGPDGDNDPLPLVQAISPVASDVEEVGGLGPDVMRAVVVLTKEPQTAFVDFEHVFAIAVSPDTPGLGLASQTLDAVRQKAFYKLAVCGATDKLAAKLEVSGMIGMRSTSLPSTLPEETALPCLIDAISQGNRSFTPRIELVFDDTQRAAYQERIKATQSATWNEALAKSDFPTGVRIAPGQTVLQATAHFRGNGSIRCDRKSMVIQLDGPARYLLTDSAVDEFTLISMCDDSAYVYAPTAFRVFSEDLFSLKMRFVELVIDGTTRGVYMLLEKPREELVRDSARVSSVLRRDYPQNGSDFFEVEYSDTEDINAPAVRYSQFSSKIGSLSGDQLIATARNYLDLDQYLSYLAHQSILRSGDYIDELYFYGAEQADGLGGTTEAYRVMAWDPEGYTNCHSGGANAFPDANQLAYCSEARLDFKLLADQKIYRLFVDKLETALNTTLARQRFSDSLNQSKLELQAWLSTPSICAAMTELLKINPGAADCTIAQSIIASRATSLLSSYDSRRSALLSLIATYRSKYP